MSDIKARRVSHAINELLRITGAIVRYFARQETRKIFEGISRIIISVKNCGYSDKKIYSVHTCFTVKHIKNKIILRINRMVYTFISFCKKFVTAFTRALIYHGQIYRDYLSIIYTVHILFFWSHENLSNL